MWPIHSDTCLQKHSDQATSTLTFSFKEASAPLWIRRLSGVRFSPDGPSLKMFGNDEVEPLIGSYPRSLRWLGRLLSHDPRLEENNWHQPFCSYILHCTLTQELLFSMCDDSTMPSCLHWHTHAQCTCVFVEYGRGLKPIGGGQNVAHVDRDCLHFQMIWTLRHWGFFLICRLQ